MPAKSNYSKFGRYSVGGGVVDLDARLGWWERKIFPSDVSDRSIVLDGKYHRRPDLLANDEYGQPTLAWLVLQFNNIIDIETEFVQGATITVPTKTRVFTEMFSKRIPTITNT